MGPRQSVRAGAHLTFGIVSAKSRRCSSNFTPNLYQEYLQTDAAVNPGNSGGPLVNIEGQIVGINAAIFGRGYQGISFAIPSSLAREKYDELRTKGKIERAWLGISPLDVPDPVREQLGLELRRGSVRRQSASAMHRPARRA